MTKMPKILVTSAAGKTGLPTALQLLEKGYPVRALVRRDDHRSARLQAAGAEVMLGDQYSLRDMRRAMRDVQRAYHCTPTAANGLHFGAVFAVAAAEARLEHVVVMSQWLADPGHPSMSTRETWLNGKLMTLLPDTSLTVNNAGWFAENYFFGLESAAQLGLLPLPLGDGDIKKNAPPSNEDIASVNVGALTDPGRHAGKIYRPTGPELLSPNQIAATMGRVLGRKVVYRDVSDTMLLKFLKAQGLPDYMPIQLRIYADEYRRGTFAVNGPTDAVQSVGGREPEDFGSIARRTIAARPDAVRSIGNKIRAIRNFTRMLLTPATDVKALERNEQYVRLSDALYAQDSKEWRTAPGRGNARPSVVTAGNVAA